MMVCKSRMSIGAYWQKTLDISHLLFLCSISVYDNYSIMTQL